MKITPELIEKYHLDSCTAKEKEAILRWLLNSNNENSELSESTLKKLEEDTWKSLSERMGRPGTKVVGLYKYMARYAAVACLLTGMLIGISLPDIKNQQSEQAAKDTSKGQVYITSGPGNMVKVDKDIFEISFNGTLELFNSSSITKTVICYGKNASKVFLLEPRQLYYLEGTNEKPYLSKDEDVSIDGDYSRYLKGYFTIHLVAA